MTITRRISLSAAAIGVAALALLAFGQMERAHAQSDAPARYYGTISLDGELAVIFNMAMRPKISASMNNAVCATADVKDDGTWVLDVPADAPCSPRAGGTVTFEIDGKVLAATEAWSPGDIPDDAAKGVSDALAPAQATTTSASTCTIDGSLPAKGGPSLMIASGRCTGESMVEQLTALAKELGYIQPYKITSLWATVDGSWVTFTPNAPVFVNAQWPIVGDLGAPMPFMASSIATEISPACCAR